MEWEGFFELNRCFFEEEIQDRIYMEEALLMAKKGFDLDEVPVGSVLVYQGEIVARAHNLVEANQDASMHAEMICLKLGTEHFKNWRLQGTTLYSTLEPCVMCAGALLLHRLERVVWGAPDLRHGAHGSWVNLLAHQHPTHTLRVTRGVMEEEASRLMKRFFSQKRV